jgi:hypothetical protein
MKLASSIGMAILLLAHAPATGQERLQRTNFRVFPILSGEWEGIFFRPGPDEDMREIVFRPRARSFDTYSYRGASPLTFYREAGLSEEGEMLYESVGQAEIIAAEMLVFFATNPSSQNGSFEFKTLSIDDSPSGLPSDHVAFVNFTQIPFACRFADENLIVRPGMNVPVSVEERLAENVFIGMAVTNQQSSRIVLQNQWRFHEGNRHIILLLPPQRKGSFRIRAYRITEFVGENKRFKATEHDGES